MRPEDADPLTVIEDQEPPPHHRHRFAIAALLGFALLVVIGLRVAG